MVNHDKLGAPGFLCEKNVFGPVISLLFSSSRRDWKTELSFQAAENYINVCESLIDLSNVERASLDLRPRNVKICFDEWNVWEKARGNANNGLEQWYEYTDMVGFVAWLNILVRKHKEVAIACLAQSVNIAPLKTRPDRVCRQTTYYPLQLFSKYMKNAKLLATPAQPDVYDGPTYPMHIQMMEMKPAYIDIVATIVDSNSIRIRVLNRHPTADWQAKCVFDGFDVEKAEIHQMYSDDLDALVCTFVGAVLRQNTFDHPDTVVPTVTQLSGKEWEDRGQ